jgi:hypothetical protein
MAGFTNSTTDAIAGLKGPALEFLVFIHEDMEKALTLLAHTVRASDAPTFAALDKLRTAHAQRAEAIAKALA